MGMALNDYLSEFRRQKQSTNFRYLNRLRMWYFRQHTVIHEATPTYLDKARSIGYKKKEGVKTIRVRVRRGGRPRKHRHGKTNGKPSKMGIYQRKHAKSLQALGEIRVGKKYQNLNILGSYWVGQDRIYKYYEVIAVQTTNNSIKNDGDLNWLCRPIHKHREARGLTGATKKSRGLGKGIRFNQTIGGSRKAAYKRRNIHKLKAFR